MMQLIILRSSRLLARFSGLGDQVVVSLSNFLMVIILVRHLKPEQYASYSMGFFFALTFSSALRIGISYPIYLMRPETFRRRERSLASLYLISITSIVLFLVTSSVVTSQILRQSTWSDILLSIASCLSLYAGQDFDRAVTVKSHGGVRSLLYSSVSSFFILLFTFVGALLNFGFHAFLFYMIMFSLCRSFVINRGRLAADMVHILALGRRILKTSFGWGALASMSSGMMYTIPQWALIGSGALHSAAGFAAVRTPLQPVMIITRALDISSKVNLGRENDKRSILLATAKQIKIYFIFYVGSLGLCSIFAKEIIHFTIGSNYEDYHRAFQLTCVMFAIVGIASPLESFAFKFEKYSIYAFFQVFGLTLTVFACYPLIVRFGASGAVISGIIGWLPVICFLTWNFYREFRKVRSLKITSP